jgi:hypothetical protein
MTTENPTSSSPKNAQEEPGLPLGSDGSPGRVLGQRLQVFVDRPESRLSSPEIKSPASPGFRVRFPSLFPSLPISDSPSLPLFGLSLSHGFTGPSLPRHSLSLSLGSHLSLTLSPSRCLCFRAKEQRRNKEGRKKK